MRHGFTPMTDKYYILFRPNLMEQKNGAVNEDDTAV